MGTFSNKNVFDNTGRPSVTNRPIATATKITPKSNYLNRTNIIENTINSKINRITDNPFYFFNNLAMTKVTFYNINPVFTTLDEEINNTYNFIGPASGLRFDKINGVILYGVGKIELNIDMGEWGTEAEPIEGEAYLPPNTIKPYQNSYFSIDYINQPNREVLFRVTSVNVDTFPNGSNFYKISYKLESIGEDINPQIVNQYQFLPDNIGKGNAVVDLNSYNVINEYYTLINMLREFYTELFFQQSTQTFVFKYGVWGYFFYDPYMIEFIMRHSIFSASTNPYIHISQPAYPPKYMMIDYDKTIFSKLEDPTNENNIHMYGYGLLVQDPMSLLTHRIEPYYMISFRDDEGDSLESMLLEKIFLFDEDMINLLSSTNNNTDCECKCECNRLLNNLPKYKKYYTIIYNFINGIPISLDDIKSIRYIDFTPCKELYYTIPMLIFILQSLSENISDNNGLPNSTIPTLKNGELYEIQNNENCCKNCSICNNNK